MRVELGGWLLREGYEPGGATPADFRNELIDSLPPIERDALMGGGGGDGSGGGGLFGVGVGVGGARSSRCPLFGRTNSSLGEPPLSTTPARCTAGAWRGTRCSTSRVEGQTYHF